jgi:hypothetical protein
MIFQNSKSHRKYIDTRIQERKIRGERPVVGDDI